ncbi:glycosyltransferase [Xanthobacteraceae bacterium Astr-EGSB]|uniref:glycosyltransferase n=1 Tax=Astrobacterium formosum TaxID=3069710 RepID=UPI0027B29E67|nr:glycosyltransferase [Xanthobacteraceae bacterium Astr-EGSB]
MRRLKYISWSDNTGYAVAAKSYIRALKEAGVDLTWTPMVPGPHGYVEEPAMDGLAPRTSDASGTADYDTVLIHTVPEYFPDWIARERAPGRRIFGYTVWELERLPSHWPDILNQLDGVMVPCRWNEKVFRNSGVKVPIHVVPHLSQFEGLPPCSEADRRTVSDRIGRVLRTGPDGTGRFVFYTIGFWSNRKAPYLALEAYWRAFDADDPVVMVVKTSDKDITRWIRHWRSCFRRRHPSPIRSARLLSRRHPRPAPCVIIADETLGDGEMQALHEIGDCFVSLARAEGWGLGAFEATKLGKPVVMTGYGGQCDFLDKETAWLVDFHMVPVHEPTWSASYKPSDQWAEPSVAQAAAHLRAIYDDRTAATTRARQLAATVERQFSKESVVRSMISALQ